MKEMNKSENRKKPSRSCISQVLAASAFLTALNPGCSGYLAESEGIGKELKACTAEQAKTEVDHCGLEGTIRSRIGRDSCTEHGPEVSCIPPPPVKYIRPYARIDRGNEHVKSSVEKGRFTHGFLDALEEMCDRNGINAMALLSIMHHETGGTFSPRIRNQDSGAVGLIQFTRSTARRLGTDAYRLSRMDRIEQLGYVEKYFRQFEADYTKPGNIASAVFFPKAIGKPHYVCGRRDSPSSFRRAVYEQNTGADTNKDGKIQMKEYYRRVIKRGYVNAPKRPVQSDKHRKRDKA